MLILLKYDLMHHLSLYFDSKVYRLIFQTTAQIPEVEYGAKYGHMRANHFSCIINRLLYSGMYNMEIYCTRPYCIENLVLDSTPAPSRPIRVFNAIPTRTISFHIVHNTV